MSFMFGLKFKAIYLPWVSSSDDDVVVVVIGLQNT